MDVGITTAIGRSGPALGRGRVYGTVLFGEDEEPGQAEVLVLEREGGTLVARTQCDATGAYEVRYLTLATQAFTVVARDLDDQQNAEVFDMVTAVPE